MSWTSEVQCRHCHCNAWTVRDGTWTCVCGQPMHDARDERAAAHAAREELRDRLQEFCDWLDFSGLIDAKDGDDRTTGDLVDEYLARAPEIAEAARLSENLASGGEFNA